MELCTLTAAMSLLLRAGFKNSADSYRNRPTLIRLEGGRAESDTRYEILVNSVVNRPNSEVSADIPS